MVFGMFKGKSFCIDDPNFVNFSFEAKEMLNSVGGE